jgi:hypothetical protein
VSLHQHVGSSMSDKERENFLHGASKF